MTHKLLQRQIRRIERRHSNLEDRYEALLEVVSQTYEEADDERRKKDRSVSLMSAELMQAHRQNQARTEAYLSSILAHVAEGIMIVDQQGKIRSFNARAEEMFGYEAGEIHEIGPLALFSGEMQPIFAMALLSSHNSQSYRSVEGAKLLGRRKNGSLFPVEFSISPVALLVRISWRLIWENLPVSALQFPLAIRPRGEQAVGTVRTILSVNESEGSMTFAGDVPEGNIAQLMMANFDRLIDGAAEAASSAHLHGISDCEGDKLAILVSCVGRKIVLGQRTADEVEAVAEILGEGHASIGFYSYGEISPHSETGFCALHNQTMTITYFAERA